MRRSIKRNEVVRKVKYGLVVMGLFVVMAMVFAAGVRAAELTADEYTVALWHFNEGSGNIVYDESGNGNHGIIHGATWTTGMFGSALNFDGVNDYVEIPQSSGLNMTDAITIETWVKSATDFWNRSTCLINKRNAYLLHPWANSKSMSFFIGYRAVTYKSTKDITQWHHYVGTYDGSNLKIYEDGQLMSTKPFFGSIEAVTRHLYIGHDEYLGEKRHFNGTIDEIRISNVARTAEEIAESASLNQRPIADAGDDQIIFVNEEAILDGTGSYDPEEEPLTYTWYEDLDKDGILEDEEIIATESTVTLTYTEANIGIHYYQLIVNDGTWDSRPDTVIIGVAGEGRPKPNMAFNISQMKIHWVGNNKGTIHFEIPELPEGITSQDDLLPQETIVTIEIPIKAKPDEYAVGQDEVDFNIYRKLWNTLPQHIRPKKRR